MPDENDLEILFPGIKYGDISVKPWSWTQFIEGIPLLLRLGELVKEGNIDFSILTNMSENENEALKQLSKVIYGSLMPLIPKISEPIVELVALTLSVEKEKVKAMDFDKVIAVNLIMLIQNAARIKNFFGLGRTAF